MNKPTLIQSKFPDLVPNAAQMYERVLDRLSGVVPRPNNSASAFCPACEADCLSVTFDDRGVAMRCHSYDECSIYEILGALGLSASDITVQQGSLDTEGCSRFSYEDLQNIIGEEAKLRPRLLYREFVDLTGSLEAALILQHLLYLQGLSGGVFKDGYHWVYKGHADRYEELRISESTAARKIEDLWQLGLIEKQAWLVRGSCKRTNHYRVVPETLLSMLAELRDDTDLAA